MCPAAIYRARIETITISRHSRKQAVKIMQQWQQVTDKQRY